MKRFIPNFITLFSGSCIAVIILLMALIFLSERFTGAGSYSVKSTPQNNSSTENNEIYVNALEKVRSEYANVKTVEMEASVKIDIINGNSIITGTGQINYVAQDNKYKYVCTIPENLVNEGLMRNVDILFNGNKYYFYDRESKVVSYQTAEEVRLPAALPNPFFLPIDFIGNEDDSCEGCKTRLQDVKMPIRWAKRADSISEITTETSNGLVHSLIQMSGGNLNKIPYNYRVRLIGESVSNLQPVSIARIKENGIPLVEILLSDLRIVQGINVKIPYIVEVGARDETGNLILRATFTINSLKVNQTLNESLLAPNFVGVEKYWDSDSKAFVEQ